MNAMDSAAACLERVFGQYPEDILADDALYMLAGILEDHYADKEKAMALYEKLITQYPGSLFVVDARKRFRQLRGDQVN
jgi:TolA-binding protein